MSYNGWANYATWAVALWVDNDEGLHNHRNWLVKVSRREGETRRVWLADALKEWVEEMMPELQGLAGDLLTHAVERVDWMELAKAWVEDAVEDEDEDNQEEG